ncbi:hypothetical protein [Ochrovirga pacifica]|uniref:hypothetical protein n=1 Tax=Ochrovirga pacifica TaxID=1042376 RepID=UPI000255871C|nr:hypothetical protein [Ochrovirga pacifica]
MKKIYKTLSLLFAAMLLFACEENSLFDGDPNLNTSPIYSVSGFNNNRPIKLNIYQQEAFVIEYQTNTTLNKYATKDYVDNSTETTFDVTFVKLVSQEQEDGSIIDQEISYDLDGDKTTGSGTLVINDGVNAAITHSGIVILEEEVYN